MRILWVSNHTPYRVDFGGGQRSNLIFRILRELGPVDVLIIAPPRTDGKSVEEAYGRGDGLLEVVAPTTRGQRGPWRFFRKFAPNLVDRIAYNFGRRSLDYLPDPAVMAAVDRLRAKNHYDFYVGRHLKNSGAAGLLQNDRAIIDIDDNEIELFRWIIRDPGTGWLRRQILARRVKSLEHLLPRFLNRSPYLWVVKEEDRASPGFESAEILPNIPYVFSLATPPSPLPQDPSVKTVLFVGMLSYIYNRQGLYWFLEKVWPTVLAQVPDAKFRIAGSHLRSEDRQAWSAVKGVDVTGYLDDLASAYRDCAFLVVPIWSGGGTNIKVLEALMYGRTCVLSAVAFKGYGRFFPRNAAVAVADNPEEMAQHCIKLLLDPTHRLAMAQTGTQLVGQHFSYAAFRQTVLKTVDSLLHSSRKP